jgi:hypothetical protein
MLLSQNKFFYGGLSETPTKAGGIACAMEYGDYADEARFDMKENSITIKNIEFDRSDSLASQSKPFGILQNFLKGCLNVTGKAVSQTSLLLIMPRNSVFKFAAGFRAENYFSAQMLFLFDRFFNSACIFSQAIPFPGLRRSFSARFSNSAICSCVSSSDTSSRICSATLQRSLKGNFRNCSKISTALMPGTYPFQPVFAIRNFP